MRSGALERIGDRPERIGDSEGMHSSSGSFGHFTLALVLGLPPNEVQGIFPNHAGRECVTQPDTAF
jgi:hypothetical protein